MPKKVPPRVRVVKRKADPWVGVGRPDWRPPKAAVKAAIVEAIVQERLKKAAVEEWAKVFPHIPLVPLPPLPPPDEPVEGEDAAEVARRETGYLLNKGTYEGVDVFQSGCFPWASLDQYARIGEPNNPIVDFLCFGYHNKIGNDLKMDPTKIRQIILTLRLSKRLLKGNAKTNTNDPSPMNYWPKHYRGAPEGWNNETMSKVPPFIGQDLSKNPGYIFVSKWMQEKGGGLREEVLKAVREAKG